MDDHKATHKYHKSMWTEAKNDRRCDLIDKEIAGTLSPGEAVELQHLQAEMLDHRRSVAPLESATYSEIHKRLDALADLGLVVSICYGECGDIGRIYSVDIATAGDYRSFPEPFGAKSLEQAIWIAEIEGPKLITDNPCPPS